MGVSLGARAYAWRKWLVAAWVVSTIAGFVLGRNVFDVLEPGGFEVVSSRTEALEREVRERFGKATPDVVALYEAEGATLDDPIIRDEITGIVARLDADPIVAEVGSPLLVPDALVARDGTRWLVTVDMLGEDADQQEAFGRIEALMRSEILDEAIGGDLAAKVEAQRISRRDLLRAELVTIPLLAVLLVVFFRGFVAALLPLLLGAFSIAMSLAVLRLLGEVVAVSLFALNIVTFLGLGLAVDYALFMVQRFREELGVGNTPEVAIRRTVSTAGKTIFYSGLAVAASLVGLMWVPILLLRSIAMAGTLVVLLTNLGAVLLLPALLALLGRRVGGVRPPDENEARASTRFWRRSAAACMRRPGLVAIAVTATLIIVGLPFLRMQTALSDARVFPTDSEVRRVYDATIDRDQFPMAGVGAHLIMVRTRGGEPITSPIPAGALFDLDQTIAARDDVEAVWSVAGAIGDRELTVRVLGDPTMVPLTHRRRLQSSFDDDATLIRVVSIHPSGSVEARQQIDELRALAPEPLVLEVTGRAARAAEVRDAMARNLPRTVGTVGGVTLVMLVLAFGAPVIAIKAVIMNVLSLSASFGALVWVFQDGRFEGLLRYTSVGAIDPTVPVMMFAIAFGLSMDYELFLISRIKEHYDRVKDNRASVEQGLTVTGPVITKAAILLLAVIAGLITGSLIFLKEIGLGLALAITIDASLIRIMLVPSTMALLGKWNWWAPKRLWRWWRRSGIGVAEGEARLADPSGRPALA
jgi:trehalose monomycolate/heme transporter